RGLRLDRLQVARPARPHQCQGHERPAPRWHDEPQGHAVRRKAHVLGRLQDLHRAVGPTPSARAAAPCYSRRPDNPDSTAATEDARMKATLGDKTVAESNDIVEVGGYQYFPNASVRLEWLEKAAKTPRDLECPHGVQFYDVVVDGARHARAAWRYE